MKSKNVFLPLEGVNRELDWRLMLAVRIASLGRRVFVGQHDFLDRVVGQAHGGVYVGKQVFKTLFPQVDLARRDLLLSRGVAVCHIDEEGAFFLGGEEDWHKGLDLRLEPGVLPGNSLICTWGKFQEAHYRNALGVNSAIKILTTGHPRFDLNSPKYRPYWEGEVDKITAKFKNFVLINTSFVFANSALGLADTMSARYGISSAKISDKVRAVELFSNQRVVHAKYIDSISRLAQDLPYLNFVVRPHPSEDIETYRIVFKGFPNIFVERDGGVVPWILSAKAVIHDGCTTGAEAYLAGTPVINYHPGEGENGSRLANALSTPAQSYAELLELVSSCGASQFENPVKELEWGIALLENLNGPTLERFVAPLEELIEGQDESAFDEDCLTRARISDELYHLPRRVVRPFFPKRMKEYRALKAVFPGLDEKEIARKVQSLAALFDKKVTHRCIGSKLVVIESRQSR